MPRIIVNGEAVETHSLNIYQFIAEEKKLIPERVVVEQNGVIVKRKDWQNTPIMNSDKIEIVSFVGGG